MDAVSAQYLRGEYLNDRHTLETISELIGEVYPVFERTFDENKGWPYELRQGVEWEVGNYSHSTNAMILFSLALATNPSRCGILVPAARPSKPPKLTKEVQEALEKGWGALKTKCGGGTDPDKDPLTNSGSFGNNDPFTLTWLVQVRGFLEPADATIGPLIIAAAKPHIESALKTPSAFALAVKDKEHLPGHAFTLLRVIQLAKALKHDSLKNVASLQQYLLGRLHNQLSSSQVRDSNFDTAELIFALEGLLQLGVGGVESAILDRVFEVVAESQQRTPHWRPVKPFISTPQGFALFPLSVEVANSLLRCCLLLDTPRDRRANLFTRHVGLFRRYTDWLLSREVKGEAKRPAPPGAAAPAATPVAFTGWHSEHVDLPDRIHLWQTSQVLTYLLNYQVLLQRHMGFRALTEVGLSVDYKYTRERDRTEKKLKVKDPTNAKGHTFPLTSAGYWREEGSPKEALQALKPGSRYRVTEQVGKRFAETRNPGASKSPDWSMLLYGSPGTGKTGIAEDLASALGWPLITVTPSDFIRRGESEVEARAQDIFDALGEQTDAVVLLDEVDRLILDRDSLDYRDQGDIFQLMTPSMLPKLKNLRSKERVVVVIGTNYADRIDPAAKRPGRIDHQFLVSPPDRKQRIGIIRKRLKDETEEAWGKGGAWHRVAEQVVEADLNDLPDATALFVYTELAQWVRGVVQELPDPKTSTVDASTLYKSLKAGYDDLPPGTVRLLSYGTRFRWSKAGEKEDPKDEKFPGTQEPFDEFFLLLYLKLEAGKALKEDEKKLATRVVRRLTEQKVLEDLQKGAPDGLKDALQKEVKDAQVIDKIVTDFKLWLAP